MKSDVYPGFSVTLRVDGADLREYQHEDETQEDDAAETHVLCYVEAVSGAIFSIQASFDPTFPLYAHDVCMDVYFDGFYATGVTENVRGRWQMNRFAFAHFHTTEEKPKADLKDKLAELGEVTLEFTKCRIGKTCKTRRPRKTFTPAVDSTVPEKALKGRAISNYVKMGNAVESKPGFSMHTEWPEGRNPFLSCTFKYRSRADLQIEGLLPREDMPLTVRSPNALTLDQAKQRIQELEARLGTQSEEKPKIKREKRDHSALVEGDDGDDEDGEVVEVSSSRKRHRTFNSAGVEVVDLSAD